MKKCVIFSYFDESVTDRRTNGPTDRPSYRDARSHLKKLREAIEQPENIFKYLYRIYNICLSYIFKRVCLSVGHAVFMKFNKILPFSTN